MDLKNLKIFEKAADLLSELSFNDQDLQKIYSSLAELLEKESSISSPVVPPLPDIKGEDTLKLIFKNMIEILNDPTKTETLQRFSSLLLNNRQLLDIIQNLAIEKIRDSLLKPNP